MNRNVLFVLRFTEAPASSLLSALIFMQKQCRNHQCRKQIHRAEGCSCKHSEENFLVWILRHQKQPVSRSLLCNRISHIPEEKYKKQNTARHQKSGHLHDPDTKQGNTDTDQQVKQHRIGYDSKFCRTFTAINFLCKKHGCAPAL